MPKLVNIKAREILDSRGNPTVEACIILDNGIYASASVPSGASTGKYEALELRDNDQSRFLGKGVLNVVKNIEEKINPKLIGKETGRQSEIDKIMINLDGTENKSNLGANSILAVSLSYARVSARAVNQELYQYIRQITSNRSRFKQVTPLFNVINGGLHGTGTLDFQEFIFIPDKLKSFKKSLQIGTELYHSLKSFLKVKKLIYSVGDEGGFTPNLMSNQDALKIARETINNSPYKLNQDVYLGLDLAATTFYSNNKYHLKKERKDLTAEVFINYLKDLNLKYGFYLLEDPLEQDDWTGFTKLTKEIGSNTLIVGDDLLATNIKRLKKAIYYKSCNSILVKLNQIGTLSETIEVINMAKKNNFQVIVSHRSGETNDDFIADLAVGTCADYVKFGAPARGERVAKYNRLLEIYRDLK